MSFIAVTYGYNQFSIFNTNASTQTLVDNIKHVTLNQIISTLSQKDSALHKTIDGASNEEENLKKTIKAVEQELKIEEDKELEMKRQQEEIEKRAAEAQKKKEKDKKGTKQQQQQKKTKKGTTTAIEQDETENKVIIALKEKLVSMQNELENIANNKSIFIMKRKKIAEILPEFKKKLKMKVNMIIDLVDAKGDKVNINGKPDQIAKDYLNDRTVYELNEVVESEVVQEEGSKQKEKGKDKDKGEDKGNEIVVNYVPVKFDGYCMRSIEEDAKYEEVEKTGGKGAAGKKKDQKKK